MAPSGNGRNPFHSLLFPSLLHFSPLHRLCYHSSSSAFKILTLIRVKSLLVVAPVAPSTSIQFLTSSLSLQFSSVLRSLCSRDSPSVPRLLTQFMRLGRSLSLLGGTENKRGRGKAQERGGKGEGQDVLHRSLP